MRACSLKIMLQGGAAGCDGRLLFRARGCCCCCRVPLLDVHGRVVLELEVGATVHFRTWMLMPDVYGTVCLLLLLLLYKTLPANNAGVIFVHLGCCTDGKALVAGFGQILGCSLDGTNMMLMLEELSL